MTDSIDNDKITLSKAVSGIAKPKNFVKLLVQCINIGIIVLMIMGGLKIWSMLFPKKVSQTQTSSFVVESGATVEHLTVISQQQQQETKRTVGLELEASSNDAGITFKKYINDSWNVGIGARFDYEKPDDDNKLQVKPVIKVGVDF